MRGVGNHFRWNRLPTIPNGISHTLPMVGRLGIYPSLLVTFVQFVCHAHAVQSVLKQGYAWTTQQFC